MKARLARLLALLLVLLVPVPVVSATTDDPRPEIAPYAILLDASGSMDGFRTNRGGWDRLLDSLQASADQDAVWAFGEKAWRHPGRLSGLRLSEGTTKLVGALDAWLDHSAPGDAAVMVTDNVADLRNSASLKEQETFYDRVRRADPDNVSRATLMLARLPFNGKVYDPNNVRPPGRYSGGRALAVYLFVRGGGDAGRDERTVRALEQHVTRLLRDAGAEVERLQVKPFGTAGGVLPDIGLQLAETKGVEAVMDPNWGLVIRNAPFDTPLTLTFHADIGAGAGFRMENALMDAAIRLENADFITSERLVRASVSPRVATLEEKQRRFDVVFDIGAIQIKGADFWRKLELTLRGTTIVKGEFAITYAVERERLFLAPETLNRWNFDGSPADLASSRPEVQERLYLLQPLVVGLVADSYLSQDAVRVPVWLQLRFPAGPLIIAGVALLTAGALAWWLFRHMLRPPLLVAGDEGGEVQPVTPGLFSAAPVASADGICLIGLRWIGVGLFVTAKGGSLRTSPFVDATGGRVVVAVADDEQPTRSFIITSREAERHREERDSDDI
ncbi:MAG TPA: hypothetical protein VD995_31000 [Azospirillum sp.]|nr:hypothetical protein [Azospirillum sp.]